MKLCQTCHQALAETMATCPSCGAKVQKGKEYIGDYQIINVVHEGHATILCRAKKKEDQNPVLIRLFKHQSKLDSKVAERLSNRLDQLSILPQDRFVQHYEIKYTSDGLWYRVSEWVEGISWSRILAANRLKDVQVAFELFYKMASSLRILHESGHFIPHLVLSDIIPFEGHREELNIKIDYKLSRFLDDESTMPGTLLNSLLNCHPDMVNNRPLDYRSDIWSLGKIFLELLTADLDGCPTSVGIDRLSIPQDGKMLLKTMLADDPTMRPQSMKEVTDTIQQIVSRNAKSLRKRRFIKVSTPLKEFRNLRLRMRILAAVVALLFSAGSIMSILVYTGFLNREAESTFQYYANLYSDSVAFVLVEYSLKDGENTIYAKRIEGTAFLVDKAGYLLTNRHVACPWLLDREILALIDQVKNTKSQIRFDYRIFLWFEGQRAYKRLPDFATSPELSDIYFIESAYRSTGKPSVSIAGIARAPSLAGSPFRPPLKDDFAFLKINEVPKGLVPLPLAESMNIQKIPKLSPVITIGFPLGSRTQADHVNVSVTKGNVRRAFQDIIHVDTSIYRGNSGGPIINEQGEVIGIATGVAFEQATSVIPVLTPLSDIGIVLPINKTIPFLQDLKSGKEKWNGVLDISLQEQISKAQQLAMDGEWMKARALIDHQLRISGEPSLFHAAGMMHYSTGDYKEAKQFFNKALWMNEDDTSVKLMLYLLDWKEDNGHQNQYRKELASLNWRSNSEFYGYLSRVLAGSVPPAEALTSWTTEAEKSWLFYVVGLINQKNGTGKKPGDLFSKSAQAAARDNWVQYLALAELNQIYKQKLALSQSKKATSRLQREIQLLKDRILASRNSRLKRNELIMPLASRFLQRSVRISDKKEILARMYEIDSENRESLVGLAFFSAISEDWASALRYIRTYHSKNGRENRSHLSLKLLELGIEHNMGIKSQTIKKKLRALYKDIKDEWYREIIKTLLSQQTRHALIEKTAGNPENLVTAHSALGFWAEGENDSNSAIKHYQEVLSTYLENFWEYSFAGERIKNLRQNNAGPSS